MSMQPIHISARWREEIVASSEAGSLVFEFTMGKEHAYFPDEKIWRGLAPDWAKDLRPAFYEAVEQWCQAHGYPFSIAENTFMYEEKR